MKSNTIYRNKEGETFVYYRFKLREIVDMKTKGYENYDPCLWKVLFKYKDGTKITHCTEWEDI
jgi:hypothetical protein